MTTASTLPIRGALLGLAAAATFGLSTPLCKLLLGSVPAVLLAGLLYLGAAMALWLKRALSPSTNEAALKRADAPMLAGIVITGGVVAPVLMLLGLSRVTALTGSLLLNLEAPFTMLLAVAVFREHLGRRTLAAALLILGGAGVLKWQSGPLAIDVAGMLLLAAACLCWAIDNNLTQRLSLRDPFAIVRIKTLVAGATNTLLGLLVAQDSRPGLGTIGAALALGAVSYGASVVLDAYALRLVGAAREAAYFATAPFVGALASMLLGDRLGRGDLLAMVVMALGVWLMLREDHGHLHEHEAIEHDHLHDHDEHHQHTHAAGESTDAPHSHRHTHAQFVHDHPHVPDAHHRHRH